MSYLYSAIKSKAFIDDKCKSTIASGLFVGVIKGDLANHLLIQLSNG